MAKPDVTVASDDVDLTQEELAAAAKAESRLANLEDDGTPDPDDPGSQADKQKTPQKATLPDPDLQDRDAADGTGVDTDATPDEKDVTLPDNFYRAAIHQGWKPEEIQEFFESSPEKAIKTFERIYHSTNRLSSEFSRLGRQVQPDQGRDSSRRTATEVQQGRPANIDWAAVETEYGKDDPLVKLVKGLLEQSAVKQPESASQRTEPQPNADPYLRQQIDSFWTSDATKPYKEFYGEGVNEQKLTLEQNKNRWELLHQADEIMAGAQVSGRRMDPTEALERAHLIITDTIREAAVRKELVAKVKVKANGITLKPKHRAKPVSTGSLTADELEERAASRLAKVKW